MVWSALDIWPLLRRALADARSPLKPRGLECLGLAFQGMTARESGVVLKCGERTINFHLSNAMTKLKVDNKLAAVKRACWFGLIYGVTLPCYLATLLPRYRTPAQVLWPPSFIDTGFF